MPGGTSHSWLVLPSARYLMTLIPERTSSGETSPAGPTSDEVVKADRKPKPMTRELNAQQLRIVLECIAGKADVVTRLLTAVERGTSEEEDEALMLSAASMLACSIGAMADDASGGNCLGDYFRWEYGPLFATLRAEA